MSLREVFRKTFFVVFFCQYSGWNFLSCRFLSTGKLQVIFGEEKCACEHFQHSLHFKSARSLGPVEVKYDNAIFDVGCSTYKRVMMLMTAHTIRGMRIFCFISIRLLLEPYQKYLIPHILRNFYSTEMSARGI